MWEAAGARDSWEEGTAYQAPPKIERSERLGSNQVRQTKPITPARRMSNANSECLHLK